MQVYFVLSVLQDESLQVTIPNLPLGSLTCTIMGDFPCTGDTQLMSRSEGWHTYLVSFRQMTLEKTRLDTEILLTLERGLNLGPLAPEASAPTTKCCVVV